MTLKKISIVEKLSSILGKYLNLQDTLNLKNKLGSVSAFFLLLSMFIPLWTHSQSTTSLKEGIGNKFHIGAALNFTQILGQKPQDLELVKENFNAIVAENCMKSGMIQRKEGEFYFDLADQFVTFGEENNMLINGHTLMWHSQTPRWFFTDSAGNEVSRDVLIQRMRDHINTVVGRYKGRVHTWDVVNEAILDDGSYRKSKFYEIIGEDFIKLAFQFANEADPDAELYYNDYSMAASGKRAGVLAMVKMLQNEGIRIDGIGMQGHVGLYHPEIEEFEKSIEAYAALNVKVMITEMDMTVLPSPWDNVGADVSANFEYEKKMNPYSEGLPDSVSIQFTERYMEFFTLFYKHQDKISRVTMWGLNDGDSWLNNWPVRGRTNYPLLFDRENKPKPVVHSIISLYQN